MDMVLVIVSLAVGAYLDTIGTYRAVARGTRSGRASGPQQEQIAAIKGIARDAMKQYDLKSIIVRVTSGGKNVYTDALGESMTGVPATPAMHFRNGAMAFTYMATLLMELVDQKKVGLDDKLGKFLP
ncbi:MAG: serine hydrolase [Chthoniobacterales bacterium]